MHVAQLMAVAAIIAGNAFLVVAEYALITARRSALRDRGPKAELVLRLMENPVRLISAVQIGITALSVLLGAIGEPVVRGLFGEAMPAWISFALAFLVVTYLSVAFASSCPRRWRCTPPRRWRSSWRVPSAHRDPVAARVRRTSAAARDPRAAIRA